MKNITKPQNSEAGPEFYVQGMQGHCIDEIGLDTVNNTETATPSTPTLEGYAVICVVDSAWEIEYCVMNWRSGMIELGSLPNPSLTFVSSDNSTVFNFPCSSSQLDNSGSRFRMNENANTTTNTWKWDITDGSGFSQFMWFTDGELKTSSPMNVDISNVIY